MHLAQPLQGPPDLARERVAGAVAAFRVVEQAQQGVVGGGPVAEGEQQVADAAAELEGRSGSAAVYGFSANRFSK
jgi:hypothetical protein